MGRKASRRGVSLLEVLISAFVLSIGLLGVIALLPVGGITVAESTIVDRAGACGRAALRDIKVRQLLADSTEMADGQINGSDGKGFAWEHDTAAALPGDRTSRPLGVTGGSGRFTWFATATPSAQPGVFWVSVVVCHGRVGDGETVRVSQFYGSGIGGGSVTLDGAVKVREGDWVMLDNGTVRYWYQVMRAGASLALSGPDWDVSGSPNPNLWALDRVVGVYSATIEVDQDLLRN